MSRLNPQGDADDNGSDATAVDIVTMGTEQGMHSFWFSQRTWLIDSASTLQDEIATRHTGLSGQLLITLSGLTEASSPRSFTAESKTGDEATLSRTSQSTDPGRSPSDGSTRLVFRDVGNE